MTMHLQSSRRRNRRISVPLIWAGAIATALTLTLASFWPAAPRPVPRNGVRTVDAPQVAAAVPVGPMHEREPLPAAEPVPVGWTFDQYVERLIDLGLLTTAHAREDRKDLATVSDAEARRLFGEMMERIADAPEQALQVRCAGSETAEEPRSLWRQQVCMLVIDAGLQYRHARAQKGDPRQALDQLTAAILGALPASAVMAEQLGRRFLMDRPYLTVCHEPAVLDLMTLAGEGRFPQEIAVGLLLTLWRNLEQAGARSSDELAALALLMLDDPKAGNRLAACMQLLTVANGRFRDLVLERVRTLKDLDLARELSMKAAEHLPVATALSVIEDLGRTGCPTTGALLFAAYREAAALIAVYEQRLADGVNAAFREELVTGIGFTESPEALAAVRMAFRSDPDLGVRIRAMFVLTGKTAAALGEQTLQEMLDDPRSASDPKALAAVVAALQNLEQAGLVNAVDRLGQRLRTCALDSLDRGRLDRLLARALPEGGPR